MYAKLRIAISTSLSMLKLNLNFICSAASDEPAAKSENTSGNSKLATQEALQQSLDKGGCLRAT